MNGFKRKPKRPEEGMYRAYKDGELLAIIQEYNVKRYQERGYKVTPIKISKKQTERCDQYETLEREFTGKYDSFQNLRHYNTLSDHKIIISYEERFRDSFESLLKSSVGKYFVL